MKRNAAKKEEIKHNLLYFYELHKEECDGEYLNATEQEKLNIYEEVNDIRLINNYFINTSIVVLTANIFEKNILHFNAVTEKKQNIVHCTINCHNNPQRPFNVNIFFSILVIITFCIWKQNRQVLIPWEDQLIL